MDMQLLIEYTWVFVLLVGLEGLLAADNALVLAIMVKHLPKEKRRKALFYGLIGALILRFGSLFIISFLIDVWQVQAIGAIYLLFISINHLYGKATNQREENLPRTSKSGFWLTVLKVEMADLAFAVDSILAAVALAVALPQSGWFTIGSLDGAQFLIILSGGMIGVIIMRFAADLFVELLHKRPGLEVAAFIIVGWVGIKLSLLVLAHPDIQLITEDFVQSTTWKTTFYAGLIVIILAGWLMSNSGNKKSKEKKELVYMPDIKLKRAYDQAAKKDGMRILVDRLWPRGVSKEDADLDYWLKEIAPSDELRKSFHHGDVSFETFREQYKQELHAGEQKKAFDELKSIVQNREAAVTLVFSAKDEKENNAKVLQDQLSSNK